jgi:DnaJ-class molecular chaperone
MSKKDGIKAAVKFCKDCDELCEIATGKHLAWVGKRIFDAFGEDVGKRIVRALDSEEQKLDSSNPYAVLHSRPDSTDLAIRGRYRLLVKRFHPESGEEPDVKEFQRVCEAYNKIKKLRENIDK